VKKKSWATTPTLRRLTQPPVWLMRPSLSIRRASWLWRHQTPPGRSAFCRDDCAVRKQHSAISNRKSSSSSRARAAGVLTGPCLPAGSGRFYTACTSGSKATSMRCVASS
jgi:hypothetical protein